MNLKFNISKYNILPFFLPPYSPTHLTYNGENALKGTKGRILSDATAYFLTNLLSVLFIN